LPCIRHWRVPAFHLPAFVVPHASPCLPWPRPAGESVVGKEELKAKKAAELREKEEAEKRKAPKAAKLLAAKGKLQKTAGG
jgi:hypothetical protein